MEPVITLSDVSLFRRTQEEFSYDLKKTIFSYLSGSYRSPKKRKVLDDVNLSVFPEEIVGVIGRNGSGKSTLMKIISGILRPTHGSVAVCGTVAPLIELGAGLEPQLSVADNILFYGTMLGRSRRSMMSETKNILEFAELEDYALTPVKGLSSGMRARLGFSIATNVRPNILLLDEVLSVGDAPFREKCRLRVSSFLESGTTTLVVSHNLGFLKKWCTKVLWMENGRVIQSGEPDNVIESYKNTF